MSSDPTKYATTYRQPQDYNLEPNSYPSNDNFRKSSGYITRQNGKEDKIDNFGRNNNKESFKGHQMFNPENVPNLFIDRSKGKDYSQHGDTIVKGDNRQFHERPYSYDNRNEYKNPSQFQTKPDNCGNYSFGQRPNMNYSNNIGQQKFETHNPKSEHQTLQHDLNYPYNPGNCRYMKSDYNPVQKQNLSNDIQLKQNYKQKSHSSGYSSQTNRSVSSLMSGCQNYPSGGNQNIAGMYKYPKPGEQSNNHNLVNPVINKFNNKRETFNGLNSPIQQKAKQNFGPNIDPGNIKNHLWSNHAEYNNFENTWKDLILDEKDQNLDNAIGPITGKCKWFNVVKGFGFITTDTPLPTPDGQDAKDIFVYQNVIQMSGFRSLKEEEIVEIYFKKSKLGWEAVQVTGPQGYDCEGTDRVRKKKPDRCYNCGEFGHHAKECNQGPLPKRCHFCKSEKHLVALCKLKNQAMIGSNFEIGNNYDTDFQVNNLGMNQKQNHGMRSMTIGGISNEVRQEGNDLTFDRMNKPTVYRVSSMGTMSKYTNPNIKIRTTFENPMTLKKSENNFPENQNYDHSNFKSCTSNSSLNNFTEESSNYTKEFITKYAPPYQNSNNSDWLSRANRQSNFSGIKMDPMQKFSSFSNKFDEPIKRLPEYFNNSNEQNGRHSSATINYVPNARQRFHSDGIVALDSKSPNRLNKYSSQVYEHSQQREIHIRDMAAVNSKRFSQMNKDDWNIRKFLSDRCDSKEGEYFQVPLRERIENNDGEVRFVPITSRGEYDKYNPTSNDRFKDDYNSMKDNLAGLRITPDSIIRNINRRISDNSTSTKVPIYPDNTVDLVIQEDKSSSEVSFTPNFNETINTNRIWDNSPIPRTKIVENSRLKDFLSLDQDKNCPNDMFKHFQNSGMSCNKEDFLSPKNSFNDNVTSNAIAAIQDGPENILPVKLYTTYQTPNLHCNPRNTESVDELLECSKNPENDISLYNTNQNESHFSIKSLFSKQDESRLENIRFKSPPGMVPRDHVETSVDPSVYYTDSSKSQSSASSNVPRLNSDSLRNDSKSSSGVNQPRVDKKINQSNLLTSNFGNYKYNQTMQLSPAMKNDKDVLKFNIISENGDN